ncbi:hypothetical protein HGP14_10695 [Rhizobium sp. P32RR-XVIII]|jgi:hypothetical protein|uniref:hypothetical protein n=1 Tax=Rhizobium sp. P32RR-XVIII TaxID=2726738 RepID=UPI001456EC62|nr:hypothetical protein [Rhizobium sp. P32RR-XVIII]NLS03821.1 hypothetical protein [Rhizobium sp. P32RR-XVIII]
MDIHSLNAEPTQYAQRLLDCRASFEPMFLEIIKEAQKNGFEPAEVAMAIADAADDMILALASKLRTAH